MSVENPSYELFSRIKLPVQDLATLSFCNSNRESKVKEWVESLPATRVSYTSVQLYKALPELARLKTNPATRIHMLESLRPYVQQCVQGLTKDFLNQPLMLPEAALKTATVAQALQKHMSNAYIVAARDMSPKVKSEGSKQHKELDLAIHRAITGLGLQLLRSYQLYISVPPQLWIELHTLYILAEHFHLLDTPIVDPLLVHTTGSSVKQAYLRVLMLACARSNQLRQNEVNALYSGLEMWTSLVTLSESKEQSEDNLFVVNLSTDLAPMYKSRLCGGVSDDIRELDIRQLIAALNKQSDKKQGRQDILRVPQEITPALTAHLTEVWGISQQRHSERRLVNGCLEIIVGLSNIHYYLADHTTFKSFLSGSKDLRSPIPSNNQTFEAKPTSSSIDPWANAFDAGGNTIPEGNPGVRNTTSNELDPPIYSINMVDACPGGYCLDWREDIPAQVRAGELLGIREDGRRKWNIGVIRWIRQSKDSTKLGIQILAPRAKPYGASMVQKTGENTGYMRALMLPELKSIHQPACLLTAAVPFREHSKVTLNYQGEKSTVQLTQRIFSTGTISQFAFRELESAKPRQQNEKPESFDSVWNDN